MFFKTLNYAPDLLLGPESNRMMISRPALSVNYPFRPVLHVFIQATDPMLGKAHWLVSTARFLRQHPNGIGACFHVTSPPPPGFDPIYSLQIYLTVFDVEFLRNN